MANYIKATDFASKDALLTGDPLKIVAGTEIDDEFNAIQTAVNTKANSNSPSLTGVPSAPTAAAATNTSQLATTAFVSTALVNYQAVVDAALEAIYPIGSVYTNATDATNPATLIGFGTWVAFGQGRVMVGLDSGNTNFDAAEEVGGSADAVNVSHTHTVNDPGHTHTLNLFGYRYAESPDSGRISTNDSGGTINTINTGGSNNSSNTTGISLSSSGESGVDKNLQPYITVYMWKRTA